MMGKKILMLVGDYAEDYLNKYVLNYVLTNLNNPFD